MRGLWFEEWFTRHEAHRHHLRRYLVRCRTRFQRAVVADSYSFGRCLILDGEMQSAALDEFIYHEALVHPALVVHPHPRRVFIMGGGEGATLREVLRHRSVERAVMVDIDGEVIKFCRRYLREWHQGSFQHPKTELLIQDAKQFVAAHDEHFDVIFSDLPSPIEEGPAYSLYTVEFYRQLSRRLALGGLFALQAGSGNLLQIHLHAVLYRTLRQVFRTVRAYYAFVPSFDVPWAFLLCSNRWDPVSVPVTTIQRRLTQRVKGPLRFYDAETHTGLFHLPKYLRTLLDRERQVFTEKQPVYFFK
ncbi:MAG: polyamine aminopropyltransferase [Elusimicrobia bacterium]|nr:polyamine aminopropyltransferase [Elusimicrobiota bacterium]